MCIKSVRSFTGRLAMKTDRLKEFCLERNIKIRFNEPMSAHTSLKIGGVSDVVPYPDEKNLPEIIRMLYSEGIPYIVSGKGSNILVKESGIRGAVIFTDRMDKVIDISDDGNITVQSGCSLQKVVAISAEIGFAGMEGLTGIPGSVGGAIAGNAGSFGYEIKDIVNIINIMTAEGEMRSISKSEAGFSYRKSNLPANSIITRASFSFKMDEPLSVGRRIREYLNEKRLRQPLSQPSAGCVFKNPADVPAGRLIDEAGCKGMMVGGILVSRLHANYFINSDGGSADDFLRLMDIVTMKVRERFGILLEPEIKIL